jgi:lipopolysaccharide exporter
MLEESWKRRTGAVNVSSQRLTRRTAHGLAWSWVTLAVTVAMQTVYTAVMSRLLDPRDFGLVAAALLGLRFVTYLSRFGLGSAVVQRQVLTRQMLATAQTLAILVGILAFATAVVLSPLIAGLTRNDQSAGVMRWLAVGLFLGSIAVVPEGVLRRDLRFKAIGLCQIVSFLLGYLVVGIWMAVRGHGVWSLVTASLAQSLIYLVLIVWLAKPPATRRLAWSECKGMLAFGGAVTVTGFLEFLQSSLDTLSVSRWIGPVGLGQYSRATYLVGLPVEQAVTSTSSVLLPSFSRVQNDPARFSAGYLLSTGPMTLVVALPVALIASSASALVPFVLGPGWNRAAAVLPIVGAAYGLNMLTHLPAVAAESLGLVTLKLKIQSVSLVATTCFLGAAGLWGPTLDRIAIGWLSGEIFRFLLYWTIVVPRLGVSRREVASRYVGAFSVAATAAIPVLAVIRIQEQRGFVALAISGTAGLVVGFAMFCSPLVRPLRSDLRAVRARLAAPN